MPVEVEFDLKNAFGVRNGRRAEPARCDIEGHMPGMIEPWRQGEPYLAGDLRPKMQRLAGICPGCAGAGLRRSAAPPSWRSTTRSPREPRARHSRSADARSTNRRPLEPSHLLHYAILMLAPHSHLRLARGPTGHGLAQAKANRRAIPVSP